jgi:hypothetical protein
MHNPELQALGTIEWQLFCTLTFARRIPERIQVTMFFALLRQTACNSGVHFKSLLWCLRRERGEQFGREHFHAVIAGLPLWFVNWVTTERMCALWRRVGGGHSKVTLYNPQLDGVDYIMKGAESGSLATRYAGDYHELSKFGGSCDLTLAEAVIAFLDTRRLSMGVVRSKGQNQTVRFVGRTGSSNTMQSGASKPSVSEASRAAITRNASVYHS